MPGTEVKENEYASKIAFWYKCAKRRQRQPLYVLKKGLTPESTVKEHLASELFRIFGVKTPEVRIVRSLDERGVNYGLASQYLKGYRDLRLIIGGDAAVEYIAEGESVTERVARYQKTIDSQGIRFSGLAEVVVANACLIDIDLIGRNYTNLGGVKVSAGTYQLVKIDPGEVNFNHDESYASKITLETPYLYPDFHEEIANSPTIFGNLHFCEVLANVTKESIERALVRMQKISDAEIRRHILREEYLELVPRDYLEAVAAEIIARKNVLAALLPEKIYEPMELPLAPIFLDNACLSTSYVRINRGNARPQVVRLLPEEALAVDHSASVSLDM